MNTKKIIIAASIALVVILAGYLIYSQLTPKTVPVAENPSEHTSDGTKPDLATFDIPDQPDAVVKIFRTVDNEIILVDKNKMTLYFYTKDTEGKSNCADVCAENWPPAVIGPADSLIIGSGIGKGTVSMFPRDGMFQLSYNGRPLYLKQGDKAPGDATGKDLPNWEVAKP